jgi:hypothetical protein
MGQTKRQKRRASAKKLPFGGKKAPPFGSKGNPAKKVKGSAGGVRTSKRFS